MGLTISWLSGSTCLNLLLSTGELISQKLTPVISAKLSPAVNISENPQAMPKIDFSDYMNQILRRTSSVPSLQSKRDEDVKPEQLLQLVLNTTEVLKQEYVQKQQLATKAVEKRVKALNNEKRVQLEELSRCLADKEQLIDTIKHISSKYDEAIHRQQGLSDRLEAVLEKLHQTQPTLSDAEKSMKTELLLMKDKLKAFRDGMNQVESKHLYQKQNISEARPLNTLPRTMAAKNQLNGVRQLLEAETASIFQLIHRTNYIKANNIDTAN
jgi:chromosome segregation ATPase